jgi:hypothetical protein
MPPLVPFHRLRLVALVALVGLASACAGSGASNGPLGGESPAPVEYPEVSGTWSGFVSVEGQGIDGSLVIRQDGPSLDVTLAAPAFGLDAEGAGSLAPDGAVTVELAYDLQCPGRAVLRGRVSADGLALDGELEASDCTGSTSGRFRFTR